MLSLFSSCFVFLFEAFTSRYVAPDVVVVIDIISYRIVYFISFSFVLILYLLLPLLEMVRGIDYSCAFGTLGDRLSSSVLFRIGSYIFLRVGPVACLLSCNLF